MSFEKDFASYEHSVALEGLGFDEKCIATIENNGYVHIKGTRGLPSAAAVVNKVDAPLKQQVFKFFREKYNLRGFIGFRPNVKKFDYHIYDMSLSGMEYVKQRTMEAYNNDPTVGTYDEAESGCIDKLIEIVAKQQSNTDDTLSKQQDNGQ